MYNIFFIKQLTEVNMARIVAGFIEGVHEALDPSYKNVKEECIDSLRQLEIATTAVCIMATASTILGLGSSGVSQGATGSVYYAVKNIGNIYFCYFTYNTSQLIKNMGDFLENPKKYMVLSGLVPVYDKQKVDKLLKRNTFLFDYAVNHITYDLFKNIKHI